MNRLNMVNVSLLFLGVIYAVAVDVKKEPTTSSRLTARAAIDPWINVTRIPKAGDPTSQMFEGCLKAARRVQYKPSFVVSPSTGFTYWRHELGQNGKNSAPSTWDKVLSANDIFVCADAAANYRLFRFEDNKCSLSNMTFLNDAVMLNLEKGHPERNKDVIFINFEIAPSSCVGNGVFINGTNGPCVNIVEFETPLDPVLLFFHVPSFACMNRYGSSPYTESAALPFPTLQNYLRTKKITGEFITGALFNVRDLQVQWDNGAQVDPSFVDASSYADYENKGIVVISSDNDYKLVVKDYTREYRGVICASAGT